MASDEDYHSESELYYPKETENYNEKESISSQHDENHQSAEFTMDSVQKYILTQRTENTVRKTDYDLNVWKRFFLEVGERKERKIEKQQHYFFSSFSLNLLTTLTTELFIQNCTFLP